MYLLFFFFFKQKSAYEVRISYWSSDVCSSDLRAPHGEAGDHRLGADQLSLWRLDRGFAAEARIRPLLRQELFALPRSVDPAPDDPGRAVARGRAVRKLGRASGRERVCKYV